MKIIYRIIYEIGWVIGGLLALIYRLVIPIEDADNK